jgi:hypothetical protein
MIKLCRTAPSIALVTFFAFTSSVDAAPVGKPSFGLADTAIVQIQNKDGGGKGGGNGGGRSIGGGGGGGGRAVSGGGGSGGRSMGRSGGTARSMNGGSTSAGRSVRGQGGSVRGRQGESQSVQREGTRTRSLNAMNRNQSINKSSGRANTRSGGNRPGASNSRHTRSYIHQHGRRQSFGGLQFWFYDGYYYGDCAWLRRRAVATGDSYWWSRYNQCRYWG